MNENFLFTLPMTDMWLYEKSLFKNGISIIAGIDEAGRGPLAGPVVAAAVSTRKIVEIEGINDSKKLSSKVRQNLMINILNHKDLEVGIGEASHEEIDELNILQASLLAFSRALNNLKKCPEFCLLDGNQVSSYIKLPQKPIIKGDSKSFLIASASIIAKEVRDKIMNDYDMKWPEYGFKKHKGYPTKFHRDALKKFGVSPIHRKSFEPVKSMLN